MAATLSLPAAPNSCSSQIVANAPTDNCVSTVITTSGQCGHSGLTCVMSRGWALGGRSTPDTRVVDRLKSWDGASARRGDAMDARHSARFTISIVIAPSGHALTHAGAAPVVKRPWHMSHLPTTPRSALYCGTP